MTYDTQLVDRIREYLVRFPELDIEEKKMFRGLAFMINGKMCVNVSDANLMCRFDPALTKVAATRKGFLPMVMKGKELAGYCYIEPSGIKTNTDFTYWINLCLDFNSKAKAAKKKR